MSHTFAEKTFSHLTYCGVCKQLLWGLVKQGLECKECQYTCHRKCESSASKCPNAAPTNFLNDTSTKDSPAEKYLRQLQQRSEVVTGSPSSSSTTSIASQPILEEKTTYQHVRAIATSDKLHHILADAVTNQDEPISAYLENQVALNPQITTKNFTRFVSRCGPVFAFRDELILLVSWKNRVDTLVSLIAYCGICLYPKLLLFIPQTILVYFIMSNYSKNNKKISPVKEKKSPKLTEKVKNISKSSGSTSQKKSSSEEVKRNMPESLLSFGFSTLFQPASDESPEYLKNLQNIQNTMGEFSDMYDWVMSQSSHINWSPESETANILQAILIITVLFGVVVYFVPLNVIFLFSGLMVYGINTRFAKYLIRELQPYIIQSCQTKLEGLMEWYSRVEIKCDSQHSIQEISVYENQRWWPMCGYLHKTKEDERSPWSNYSGTVLVPNIAEMPPPKGCKWKESNKWKLDETGPWIDDSLEIEISVVPNQDGWIYSNDDWIISIPQETPVNNFEEKQKNCTMTRRRRWVRECERDLHLT